MKTAGAMEQAQVGFNTLLGSAQAGEAFMAQLQAMALRTPFDLENLQKTSQYLMAVGYDAKDVIPTLTAFGNAAAALNTGEEGIQAMARALGQMRRNGVLSLEEIGQLADASVDAYGYLAQASGRTIAQIRKDAENGLISGTQAADIITKGLANDPRFQNAMDNQSKTFLGQIANFRERAKLGMATAFTPMRDFLARDVMPDVNRIGEKGFDRLGKSIVKLTARAKGAYPQIKGLGAEMLFMYRQGGFDSVVSLLDDRTGSGGRLVSIWEDVQDIVGNVKTLWVGTVWPFLQDAGPKIFDIFVGAVDIIRGITDLLVALQPVIDPLLDSVVNTLDEVKGILNIVSGVVGFAGATANAVANPVDTVTGKDGGPPKAIQGISNDLRSLFGAKPLYPGQAKGGITRKPGMSWVGERGPELLSLPKGARVDPLPEGPSPMGPSVIFEDGAIRVSGSDVLNAQRTADIIVRQIKGKLARA
nr:tape measure protein [Kineococcus vitellinus]